MTINNHHGHAPPLETFSFLEAGQLAGTVSDFLKDHLDIIFMDPQLNAVEAEMEAGTDFISHFEIKPEDAALPIYTQLDSPDRLHEIIRHINGHIQDMSDGIGRVLETYEDKMGDHLQAVEMLHSLTRRFNKTLNKRVQRLTFEEDNAMDTTKEMKTDFFHFLRKIVDENLLARIVPSIYQGMKSGRIDLYQLVLKPINTFLARLGIYTLSCRVGDKMDYDYSTPLAADNNITHDFKLKEVIKEVKHLPYVFDKEHIVSEGSVVVWRFRNE